MKDLVLYRLVNPLIHYIATRLTKCWAVGGLHVGHGAITRISTRVDSLDPNTWCMFNIQSIFNS